MTGPPKGSANAAKHYIYASPDKLPAEQINRLAELRQMVKSEPGRLDLREELTARMILVVDLGFAHLIKQQEDGADNIWATDVMKRLQGFVAESRRLLDSFNQNGNMAGMQAEHRHIAEVLENVTSEKHRENES